MTLSRVVLLPKYIQKMCQAGLITFCGLLGLAVGLWGVFQNGQIGIIKSLALGIVLWLFPNVYFLVKIMRHIGRVSGKRLLSIFYREELTKLLFSGVFFLMIIKVLSINVPVLFLAYIVSQLLFWLLFIIKSEKGL